MWIGLCRQSMERCVISIFIFRDLKNLLRQVGKSLYPLHHIQQNVYRSSVSSGRCAHFFSASRMVIMYLACVLCSLLFRLTTRLSFFVCASRTCVAGVSPALSRLYAL